MHQFVDFKGFSKASLDLFNKLTVLIGPNGSGKTNAIEAIELLSFIAHGRPLHEIKDIGRGGGLEIRGGVVACPRYGKKSFTLKFSAYIGFEEEQKPFEYLVTVRVKPQPMIAEERLIFGDRTLIFETVTSTKSATSGDITVVYNNFAKGGNKPKASVPANRSVLAQYVEFAKNNRKYDACVVLVRSLMSYLKASFVFDPNPKLMRNYERIGNRVLQKDGSNLSAVLYGLQMGSKADKAILARLVEWIRQVPEEPFGDIDFVTTKLNDVILAFKYGVSSSQLVDARLLSDGTLRCFAVLTALETAEEGSRVIIEEFDNGLHPTRVNVLAKAIKDCCERRRVNVLVTTHNPATLNVLDQAQLGGVVICSWNSADKSFGLIPLKDLPRYAELLERGRLGDLVTRRIVEQYIGPNVELERKQQLESWLQNL